MYSREVRLALVCVALWLVAGEAAQAQPRVIRLDDLACPIGRPRMPTDWVVSREDACPSATLTRLCGGAASASCAPLAETASALGDAIDRCPADPALLPVAGALFDEPGALDAARRLYRVLAGVRSLRVLALFRAGRAAHRQSLYAEATLAYGEALSTGAAGPLRDAIVLRYVDVLAYDDHDEDGIPDAHFPDASFELALLPDAPWAREVDVRTLRLLTDMTMTSAGLRAADAIAGRWPSAPSADLDELRAELLEHDARYEELATHLLASVERCTAQHVACAPFLDRLERLVLTRLSVCGPPPTSASEAPRLRACLAGVSLGERLLSLRASPSLALDVADAASWVGDAVARSSARVALSGSDSQARAEATARLAAPTPPAPPPLRTHITPSVATEVEGDLDRETASRALRIEALRARAPRTSAAVHVVLHVATDGAVSSIDATPTGAAAQCVTRALGGLRVPAPEGGPATLDGVIVFPPP